MADGVDGAKTELKQRPLGALVVGPIRSLRSALSTTCIIYCAFILRILLLGQIRFLEAARHWCGQVLWVADLAGQARTRGSRDEKHFLLF